MNKDDALNLALGLAVGLLAFAVWKRMRSEGGAPDVFGRLPNVINPESGWGFDPYNPGELILSGDLVNGTIADHYRGNTAAGDEIPTASALVNQTVKDFYGVQDRPGEFMRNPGVWW